MSVFVDASALVAMIVQEPDGSGLERRLIAESLRLTSAVAMWEATVAIARMAKNVEVARAEVERYCGIVQIVLFRSA